jgi:hypothetical protein
MGKAWAWIKAHPLPLVLGLGALVLLWLVIRGSGGGGGQTVVAGGSAPDPGATQVQLAQIAAGSQADQTSAQLSLGHEQIAAGLAEAMQGFQSKDYEAMLAGSVATSGIQAQENVQLAGIQSQVQLADIAATTNRAQIGANVDMATLTAHTYESMAASQSQTSLGLAQIGADERVTIAQGAQKTAQKKSSNDLIGGIIGGVLSIFSDERLKENIRTIGYDAKGRRWVEYNYIGGSTKRQGVIAQEVMETDPEAVHVWPFGGFLMVDYGKLQEAA